MALFRRPKVARDDMIALRQWVAERSGVEAYVEPRTSSSPNTVVLVAGDGEFTRRQVPSPQAAADFARSVGIPVYDTNRVGLPQRMRDYAVRRQSGSASVPPAQATRTAFDRPSERAAIETVATVAGRAVPAATATRDELLALLRAARANAHPDRNNGDRSRWDAVEDAAKALGLS